MQKKLIWIVLGVLLLFNLVKTVPMMTAGLPPGGDNALHISQLMSTIDSIKDGVWWNDLYNAGFPMFFYYNPVAFIVLALMSIVSGISAIALYKTALVLVYAAIPFSFYFAARWMKLSEVASIFSAISSVLFSSFINFGIEPFAFFGFGLFSEMWAVNIAPFAVAAVYRAVHLKKSVFVASLLLSLLFLTHVLTGYLIALLSIPLLFADRFEWRKLARLGIVGLGMLVGIGFLLVPALLYQDYYGGLPFDTAERTDGYGFNALKQTFQGHLLDNESFPVLSVLALVGLIVSFRTKGLSRYFAMCFVLSVLFIMGKPVFGNVLNFIPGLKDVQLFRFILPAHIFAAFLIGLGSEWLVNHAKSKYKINHLYAAGILLILLLPSFWHSYSYTRSIHGFPEIEKEPGLSQLLDQIKYNAVGRTEVRKELFTSNVLPAIGTPVFTEKPIGYSPGGGSHDALSYYYLNLIQNTEEHFNLFNIEYVLFTEKFDRYTGRNVALKVRNSSYFDLVRSEIAVDAQNKESRNILTAWMFSKLLTSKEFIRIGDVTDAKTVIKLTDDSIWKEGQDLGGFVEIGPEKWNIVTPLNGKKVEMPALLYFSEYPVAKKKTCGKEITETVERGHYSAKFDVASDDCYALLKVSAFPEWHAYVDSSEVPWTMLSPSFMGVKLDPGVHTVDFKYSVMPLRKWLLFFSVAGLIGLFFIDRKYLFKI